MRYKYQGCRSIGMNPMGGFSIWVNVGGDQTLCIDGLSEKSCDDMIAALKTIKTEYKELMALSPEDQAQAWIDY